MEVKFSDSTTLPLTDNDDNVFPKIQVLCLEKFNLGSPEGRLLGDVDSKDIPRGFYDVLVYLNNLISQVVSIKEILYHLDYKVEFQKSVLCFMILLTIL